MQSSTDRAVKPFRPAQLPLQSLDWSRLIPLLGSAHKELAHFDALLRNIPDAWLLLSPLTTQEAVLSSRIEGTQATLEEVLHFQAEGKTSVEKHRSEYYDRLNRTDNLNLDGMKTLRINK